MLATTDPANADIHIALYNQVLTRMHQARRKIKAETSGDLNAFMEDGREDLAAFDDFQALYPSYGFHRYITFLPVIFPFALIHTTANILSTGLSVRMAYLLSSCPWRVRKISHG